MLIYRKLASGSFGSRLINSCFLCTTVVVTHSSKFELFLSRSVSSAFSFSCYPMGLVQLVTYSLFCQHTLKYRLMFIIMNSCIFPLPYG